MGRSSTGGIMGFENAVEAQVLFQSSHLGVKEKSMLQKIQKKINV